MTEKELLEKVTTAYAAARTAWTDTFSQVPGNMDILDGVKIADEAAAAALIQALDLHEVYEDSARMDLADCATVQNSLFGEFIKGGDPRSLRCALDELRHQKMMPVACEQECNTPINT